MAVQPLLSPERDIRVGHRGPVVLSIFYTWPNRATLKVAADAQRTVAAKFGKVVTLSIIPTDEQRTARNISAPVKLPQDEHDASLKATVAVSEDLAKTTVASAMVILSGGLLSVMVRSFLAGMSLLSRSQMQFRSFRTLAEAVTWLESVPGSGGPFPGLVQDVEAWLNG